MDVQHNFDEVLQEINNFNGILKETNYKNLSISLIKPILYNYLSFLSNEDFSIRSASQHGIKLFLENHYQAALKETAESTYINFMIEDFLSSIKFQLRNKDEIICRGVLDIWRIYLKVSGDKPQTDKKLHLDLNNLLNILDEEQDFFCNIMHAQLHKRFKAIRQATAAVKAKKISIETELGILLPIANSFIWSQLEYDPIKKKQLSTKKSGYGRQIIVDAIEMVGAISSDLTPELYFGLLKKYTIKLKSPACSSETIQQSIVNTICSIMDNFVFPVPDATETLEKEISERTKESQDIPQIIRSLTREKYSMHENYEIENLLGKMRKTVFPILKTCMCKDKNSKEEEGEHHKDIKPNIALALVRVAKKLSLSQYLEEYQKIITIIVGPLRSKDFELREKVRTALYDIVDISSPFTLQIILEELISGLTKDYQRHVLMYTIYGIFKRISQPNHDKYVNNIDHCIECLLPVLMKGVTGAVAEETETEEVIRQCKEAKNAKTASAYGLLARLIKMDVSLLDILKPLIDELETTKNVKHIHKCEQTLNKIAEGVMKNPTIESSTLIKITKELVEKGLTLIEVKDEDTEEKRAKFGLSMAEHKEQNYTIQEGAAGGKRVQQTLRKERKNEQLSGKAIAFFGFSLIQSGMSKGLLPLPATVEYHEKKAGEVVFAPEEKKQEPMEIEPVQTVVWVEELVPQLIRALKTPYTPLTQVALRIYDNILNRKVKAFETCGAHLLECLIKQFDYLNLNDQELVTCIFRCVTHIIEAKSSIVSLEKPQLEALLDLIKSNMREAEKELQVFRCVRAIINSGYKIKKIEEIVDFAAELMITSYSKSIRENCGGIFLDYVLKRVQAQSPKFNKKMQFILKNLSYEDDESRLYLLEILCKILQATFKQTPEAWIDTLFVTLVLRLANEGSSKCKQKIIELIEYIFSTSPKELQNKMFGSVLVWFKESNDKLSLKSTAFQLTGIVIKIWKDSFLPHIDFALSQINSVISLSIEKMQKEIIEQVAQNEEETVHEEIKEVMKSLELFEENTQPKETKRQDWMTCYMSLVCLERMFEYLRGHLLNALQKEKDNLIEKIALLLDHNHYWNKLLSSRILGHYFSDRENDTHTIVFFEDHNKANSLAIQLLKLFKSQNLNEQLATQATKNLMFILKKGPESSEIANLYEIFQNHSDSSSGNNVSSCLFYCKTGCEILVSTIDFNGLLNPQCR